MRVAGDAGRAGVPALHSEGIERVAWHAVQGHSIFLMSGTLLLLAQGVALQLVVRLAARVTRQIRRLAEGAVAAGNAEHLPA